VAISKTWSAVVWCAPRVNDIPLFDKGGTLDELIARCEEDSGLAPPAPPVFPDLVEKIRAAE
tara:strand:- start:347 stop:532 length:186 start_codon:yes stop_codon:yes gene_type:complete